MASYYEISIAAENKFNKSREAWLSAFDSILPDIDIDYSDVPVDEFINKLTPEMRIAYEEYVSIESLAGTDLYEARRMWQETYGKKNFPDIEEIENPDDYEGGIEL
jgi:hypothetical protein